MNIRLKKIIGQLTNIMKMIEEKEDCEKTIIQFQAAKGALESAFSEMLSSNLKKCLKEKDNKSIEKIIHLISKI